LDCVSNSKRRKRAIIFAALLAGAVVAQETYPVSPKFQRQPAIQETLDRVDAAQDEWTGEQDFEELQKQVKETVAAQPEITARFRDPGGNVLGVFQQGK